MTTRRTVTFVVQRYGHEVAGGAESLARQLAQQLASRGHRVRAITSCALDYQTWEDHFPPGVSEQDGVEVERLSVARPRDPERFGALSARVFGTRAAAPLVEQAWMVEQGPMPAAFPEAIVRAARQSDVMAFMTYLYPTSVFGLPAVAPIVPTVLHPTAHDEAPMRRPIIRQLFDHPDGLAFSTPEEEALVKRRFRPTADTGVIGIGFDPHPPAGRPERFRQRYGLGDDPYLLLLGRLDVNKAADEAIALVQGYRARHNTRLRLVLMGQPAMPVPEDPGLVVTGFVDDQTRWDALAGAVALLQPSYQESFSMALAESWLAGRPGLVQRHCEVLAGLATRGRGALAYHGAAEFNASVDLLVDEGGLADALGRNGGEHVRTTYSWDAVMDAYEALLERAIVAHAALRD